MNQDDNEEIRKACKRARQDYRKRLANSTRQKAAEESVMLMKEAEWIERRLREAEFRLA